MDLLQAGTVGLALGLGLWGCGGSQSTPGTGGSGGSHAAGTTGSGGTTGDGTASSTGTNTSSSGTTKDGGAPAIAMEVLFPPPMNSPEYTKVQTYLMPDATVTGAVLQVSWSDFDLGDAATGTHTAYDFTIPDAAVAPWIAAGKKVSFALQNSTYGGGANCPPSGSGSKGTVGSNCAMPGWVWTALGSGNITTCTGQQVANFLSPKFITSYQAAIKALVGHYGANASVAYLRLGLGRGGETNIAIGWDDTTTPCGQAYVNAWGFTVGTTKASTWNNYLQTMIEFEGSLASPVQLMTSITPVVATGITGKTIPDFIAPIAVAQHVGFGNQGLQFTDVNNCPGAGGDWCQLFSKYAGQVPLELQTFGQSCPAGYQMCPGNTPEEKLSTATGSLVPLLPWAAKNHTTILELYYQDWLIAFDPTDPSHAQYGAAYATAIKNAAMGM